MNAAEIRKLTDEEIAAQIASDNHIVVWTNSPSFQSRTLRELKKLRAEQAKRQAKR